MMQVVAGERSNSRARHLRAGVVIALVMALTAFGGAQPASAEDDYVRYAEASFHPTDAARQNPDRYCRAFVYIAETTSRYIEAYGEMRCSTGRMYLETDLRVTNSSGSVGWIRRDRDLCNDPYYRCRVESSAISGLRATPGARYCFQLFAYSQALITKSGYATRCITAA